MRHLLPFLLAVAFSAAGCASPGSPDAHALAGRPMVETELFCGASIPGGGAVSVADWTDFLATAVTPRFPSGLTVFDAHGQWREAAGKIAREDTHVLLILHEGDAAAEASIAAVIAEYKRRFRQEAVMRVDARTSVTF